MARDVRRTDVLDGHALRDAFVEDVKRIREVAEVNVKEPGLARKHPRDADVSEDLHDFVLIGEGGAVVAQGDLHAEHFRNREHVGAHVLRDRGDRIGVVARPHPARGAFVLEAADLGEEVFDGARHAVGARDAEEGRHARLHEFGEDKFGTAAVPAAFAAAARNVDVLVDKTRSHDVARSVDHFEVGEGHVELFSHRDDFAARKENVAGSEVFRRVDVGVLDEDRMHGWSPIG